ncbi:hypothetical protein ACH4F6_37900 [Streptomyces sp. NPDC017936]|uniref:DNA polymerase III subunit beta n=1 Tax=Streptomyces sp. NPDC017936 TaxID=3365016 RepID=UPI003798BEEA
MTTPTKAPADAQARFTATHRELSDALKVVALGIAPRPTVPVLGGVMAETRDGVLTLRGFDYETSVSVRVDGEAGDDGLSLLHFHGLRDVLAASVAGEKAAVAAATRITVDGTVLSTDDFTVPLDTLKPAEYPAFPPDAPAQVTVDGAEWFRQVARVLPATGTDLTLPALTHVHLRIADGVLRLSATDRYRLAVAEVDATGDGAVTEAMVPSWLLDKVTKLLGKHTGPVTVGVDTGSDWITFTVGPVTITTRATADASDFPKVWDIIPTEATPLSVRADREALVRAVRKATALSKAKGLSKGPRVHLKFGPDGITVSPGMEDPVEQPKVRGIATAGELLAGRALDGPLIVNGLFLLDALGTFAGDTLVLHAQTPTKPFLLTDGASVAGDGFRLLHMPIRVTS